MTSFYLNYIFKSGPFKGLFRKFLHAFSALLLVMMINSCEEDGTFIGRNILPVSDFAKFASTDTMSIRSYTLFSDSSITSNPPISYLGQINDPVFGSTKAEFVSQLRLGYLWEKKAVTVDSVKLYITFDNVTGNTKAGHKLRFSEITNELFYDSAYYAGSKVDLSGFSWEVVLPALKADTINSLALDVPASFGNYLMRNQDMLFHADTIPDFISYFRGLLVQVIPNGDPVLLSLSINSSTTPGSYVNNFTINMHDSDNNLKTLDFAFDSYLKKVSFNRFVHDFNAADPDIKINHINDKIKDTLTYIQAISGVYSKIVIPGLADIKNDPEFDGITINKARLICPVLYDGDTYIPSKFPSKLYLMYKTSSGQTSIVPDFYLDMDHVFYNGAIDTIKNNYSFNIASYVQGYLDDTKGNLKPELNIALAPGTETNAILRANDNSKPMRFEFTYTRNH